MAQRLINIRVRTNQSEFGIEDSGGETVVCVKSGPKNDDANREIVCEFSRIYGSARIIRGFRSKHKTILIED